MSVPPPPLLLGALAALLAAPSLARSVAANASTAPSGVEVTVGVLLPEHNLRYPWAWPRVAPALSLALEALEPRLRHAGLALRTAFASTEGDDGTCQYEVTLLKATELKTSPDPDVLLGLGCPYISDQLASFAQYWRLPLLRAGAYQTSRKLGNMTVYAGPAGLADRSVFKNQLFRHFNWTSRPLVVLGPGMHWGDSSSRPHFHYYHHYRKPGNKAVRFIQAKGRVVFICGSLKMLQEIMRLAQAQNMTNGDYVFFYLDIFGESLRAEGHREAAKPWQSKESPDTGGLREAFQMVLVFTSHEPRTPEYQRFQSQLILRAQRDFGVALNDSLGTLVAGCFHDVLLLYLRALNETLREGGTKRDTSRILEKMRGLKIQGVTGTVSIDSDNDREMDFDLWAMKDVESGEYQVVAHYVGPEKWINWTGSIPWKKWAPPLDNPPCVFNKDDPSCGTRAVSSTMQRQEAEKYGFVIT